MRHYLYTAAIGVALLAACADNDMVQLSLQEPSTLANYDYLKEYGTLKSYADFTVGVSMDSLTFLDSGIDFRIAASNFSEIVAGTVFSHASTVGVDGKVTTDDVVSVAERAAEQGMSVFAYPLISNVNNNSIYLNSLLLPTEVRPEGDVGGYSMKITNTQMEDAMSDAQVTYTFAKTISVSQGQTYNISFKVRGTTEGTAQCCIIKDDVSYRFSPDIDITTEWKDVELSVSMPIDKSLTSIVLNVGKYLGTLYVDDIKLWRVRANGRVTNLNTTNTDLEDVETTIASISIKKQSSGLSYAGISDLGEGYDSLSTFVDKTEAEIRTLLLKAMDSYADSVVNAAKGYVNDWGVLCDALDETGLVTGDGKTPTTGVFYWSDYLGKDYGVDAFKCMAKYVGTEGNLYICDTGLENSADKCDALLDYVDYIERGGGRVDGIGVSMDLSLTTADRAWISQMLGKLAATGKKVKITHLQVTTGDGLPTDSLTEDKAEAQSDLYQYVVEAYKQQVPQSQRGGIVQGSILDNDAQPVGLWSRSYARKHAYGGFVKGLSDND